MSFASGGAGRTPSNSRSFCRSRLRLRVPEKFAPDHPVISARPYKVFLNTPQDVWDRIDYVEVDDPRVTANVDTPDDYASLQSES